MQLRQNRLMQIRRRTRKRIYGNSMKRNHGDEGITKATELLKEMLEPLPGYMCSYIRSILAR